MRRAARTDATQTEIVSALRQMGCSVALTHQVGNDFPDLVVGYRGRTFLVELKDGRKPPSKRTLSAGQRRFATMWRGDAVLTFTSVDDAIAALVSLCD